MSLRDDVIEAMAEVIDQKLYLPGHPILDGLGLAHIALDAALDVLSEKAVELRWEAWGIDPRRSVSIRSLDIRSLVPGLVAVLRDGAEEE